MKKEIEVAADWWCEQLGVSVGNDQMLAKFRSSLIEMLHARYQGHWYPEQPQRGSGHRSLEYSVRMDPVLKQAGDKVGVQGLDRLLVHCRFIVMFINPGQVRLHRIGGQLDECLYQQSS